MSVEHVLLSIVRVLASGFEDSTQPLLGFHAEKDDTHEKNNDTPLNSVQSTPDTSVQSESESVDKTLTSDTSVQSESASTDNCSTREKSTMPSETANADNYICMLPEMAACPFSSIGRHAQLFSEDLNEAKYDNKIREGNVADQKLDDTAVTSDETLVQFEAGAGHGRRYCCYIRARG
jgi:hypothetical protein